MAREAQDQRRRDLMLARTVTAASDGGHVSVGQQRLDEASVRAERCPPRSAAVMAGDAHREHHPRKWGRRRDDTRCAHTPNGSSPAIWNELSLWYAIEMQPSFPHASTPACTHVRLSPLAWRNSRRRLPEGPTSATSGDNALCSHAIAAGRYR
jgi:hypothetical protein